MNQQAPFDVTQAVKKNCSACDSELFDKAFRISVISQLAPGNKTNQDVMVEYPTYVCRKCGWEFGVSVVEAKAN